MIDNKEEYDLPEGNCVEVPNSDSFYTIKPKSDKKEENVEEF